MSLYELQREGDVEELLAVVESSDSPAVRRRAAEALGELDVDEEAVETLIGVAAGDDDDGVRAAAVDALDRHGRSALVRFVAEITGVEIEDGRADWAVAKTFAELLDADRPEVRMAAATALGGLGGSETVGTLLGHLDDPDARVRARVARALGDLADPRAVEGLCERLEDDDVPPVRREAAVALGAIGNDRGLEALVDALEDDSEAVRRAAASALGEFSRAEPIEPLVGALTDGSEPVRRAAVYSVVQLLSEAPSDRSHQVRESVVEELAAVEERGVTAPLVELLEQSTQATQRRNATWLLGRVADGDDRAVVDALVGALDDDDQMTTQFAATSLAEIGGDLVRERLLASLDDPETSVDATAMAAFALGKVGGDGVRQRLEALVDETEHEPVRKRAFSALSKLGGAG